MARKYNIRWNDADEQELARVVKNFNAKISRLEKKDPTQKNLLPEKVSARDLKQLIETRQDLNRELNSLRRFSKRGAETIVEAPNNDYNLKLTKWQKEDITRRTAVINRKRNQRLSDIEKTEATDKGKKLGYTRGEVGMGSSEKKRLAPVKAFTSKMNRADLNRKHKLLRTESADAYWNKRDQQMIDNYINSLESNFSSGDIKDIVDKIRKMDFKDFKKIYDAEGKGFELNYPEDREKYLAALSEFRSIWMPEAKPK